MKMYKYEKYKVFRGWFYLYLKLFANIKRSDF